MSKALWALMIMGIVTTTEAATISLRLVGTSGNSVTLPLSSSATLEIVLSLQEGEVLGFANVFFDVTTNATVGIIEAFDFESGLASPPAVYDRSVFTSDANPFPFAEGEGITLEQYSLVLRADGLEGPREVVLERVSVRGLTEGELRVKFDMANRPPTVFTPASSSLPLEIDPTTITFVVGGSSGGNGGPTGGFCGISMIGHLLFGIAGLTPLLVLRRRRARPSA